jgi:NAD(P)-dependent dehydrogenase (short-subunit alcohol dehydrogenase family)
MLCGVTALVTGGTRGIGRACAADLARAGARVVVTSRDLAAAEAAAARLPRPPSSSTTTISGTDAGLICHVGAQCDVRSDADVARLFERLKSLPGAANAPLGVVVNAAGVNYDGLLLRLRVEHMTVSACANCSGPRG